jgi:hypothetical protein
VDRVTASQNGNLAPLRKGSPLDINDFVKNEILMHSIITVSNHINSLLRLLFASTPDSYTKIMGRESEAEKRNKP